MTKETAATQYVTVTLIAKTCRECSIAFGVPDYFDRQKLRDGTTFHCPNGHGSVYRDTDETRLRRELGEAQAAAKAERERAERLDRQLDRQQRPAHEDAQAGHGGRLSRRRLPSPLHEPGAPHGH